MTDITTTLRALLDRAKREPLGYSAHTALTAWLYANAGALLSAAESAQSARADALECERLRSALEDARQELVLGCAFAGRGQPDQNIPPYPSLHQRMFAASERARIALLPSAIRALGKETGQ